MYIQGGITAREENDPPTRNFVLDFTVFDLGMWNQLNTAESSCDLSEGGKQGHAAPNSKGC